MVKRKDSAALRSAGDNRGYFVDDTFHLTHDAGFFSMCSAVLFELSRREKPVAEIRADESFSLYGKTLGGNPWLHYFLPPKTSARTRYSRKNPFGRRLRHHSNYSDLPLFRAQPYLRRYFLPSAAVVERKEGLSRAYSVNPPQTLTVWYRGTDKASEITLDPPEKYLDEVKKLIHRNPRLRVHVQTDQEQVRSFFLTELGDRAFFFRELPVSSTQEGIHFTTPDDQQIQSGQDMLATVLFASQSRHLITHTGNVALWTVLFRGHTKRTLQLGIEPS
jgi:hypothetical protein